MKLLKIGLLHICLVFGLIFSVHSLAAPKDQPKPPIVFSDEQQESDYQELAEELRCLVCQNQNLIDSNSDLADDLRREVATLLEQGNNKQQVKDFMVARYGDFVLYNPPVKPSTYLLWIGPFLLMFLAIYIVLKIIRKRASSTAVSVDSDDSAELSEQEQQRLNDILNDQK